MFLKMFSCNVACFILKPYFKDLFNNFINFSIHLYKEAGLVSIHHQPGLPLYLETWKNLEFYIFGKNTWSLRNFEKILEKPGILNN